MKIRLVLVIPTMEQGGAERQVALLAAGLPRDVFDVHVLLLTHGGPREAELQAANVDYSIFGKRGKLDVGGYFRLKRRLRELRPDIVHTFLFAANAYARKAAAAIGVPVIIGSERCVDLWKTPLHFWIDRRLARKSQAITTNSLGVVEFYRSHGIPESLFHVIPNAATPRAPGNATRNEVAARLGMDPDRKWIVAVGRLWPQKRYRDLIWAGEMINTLRCDDTSLIIVGDGPQRGELMRYRDAVSNPQRIFFAGHRDDVPDLLGTADAFWLGSAYEGQSNALLEAMQAGLPCVVSDIPGNRDLIEHDVTGAVVDLGDAADFVRQTHHLWEHDELRETVTRQARERVATQFTLGNMLEAHQRLYQQLLKRSN